MDVTRTMPLGLVLCLLAMGDVASAAPRNYPMAPCRPGMSGPCVPARITYGYYPTSWRRWPTDRMAELEQPAPELVPTPARQETLPSAEPESPVLTPEDVPLTPTEPGAPTERGAAPLAPPFGDTPPEPPRGAAQPGQTPGATPPGGQAPAEDLFPEPPSRIQLPPIEDSSPPTMPEDDPFKDEPTSQSRPPAESMPQRPARLEPGPQLTDTQANRHWRGAKTADVHNSQAAQRPSVSQEPGRLEPVASAQAARPLPQSEPSGNVNPLRRQASPASGQTVPAASWTGGEQTVAEPVVWRRNPLRAN